MNDPYREPCCPCAQRHPASAADDPLVRSLVSLLRISLDRAPAATVAPTRARGTPLVSAAAGVIAGALAMSLVAHVSAAPARPVLVAAAPSRGASTPAISQRAPAPSAPAFATQPTPRTTTPAPTLPAPNSLFVTVARGERDPTALLSAVRHAAALGTSVTFVQRHLPLAWLRTILSTAPTPQPAIQTVALPVPGGVGSMRIASIARGSVYDAAGLASGDIVVSINGSAMGLNATSLLPSPWAGPRVAVVEVLRGAERIVFAIDFRDRSSSTRLGSVPRSSGRPPPRVATPSALRAVTVNSSG